jgi:hypothetical protein
VAFDVGLVCEIQVAAVGLALAGERGLQVLFGLGAFEGLPLPPMLMFDRITHIDAGGAHGWAVHRGRAGRQARPVVLRLPLPRATR